MRKNIIMPARRFYYCLLGVFIGSTIKASDKIYLSDIPCTDAAYFWTVKGKRLPVKNKNLFGNEISIAGVKYKKGVAGHSPFSVVYNLSGQAVRFTAFAGIDDQSSPRDPKAKAGSVVVVVLVDRKEVFREIVRLGENPVFVDIDLKEKHQLELRAKYGAGCFQKQRVVFANPEIEVINKKTFLKTAKKWIRKVEVARETAITYPPAPDWKAIKIEKIKYLNWSNAYRINNGKCELVIVPEFGGRIMSFRLLNGKNILSENGEFKKSDIMKRGYAFTSGGHFMRPQPRNYFIPCDPILLFGKYDVKFPSEGEIVMTSRNSWYLWLRYRYRIKVTRNESGVEIINTQKNIAPFSNSIGIWSITRVNPKLAKTLMMPLEMQNAQTSYTIRPEELYSFMKKNDNWIELNLTDESWKAFEERGSMEWQEYPSVNQLKVSFPNVVFMKSFEYKPTSDNQFMGAFFPAHIFACKRFIEVECHGPTKELACGKEIELKEKWGLSNVEE